VHGRRIGLAKPAIFVVASAYSLALLIAELTHSQDFVRPYFADCGDGMGFYGVNTTVSRSLLWSCALLFAVCFVLAEGSARPRARLFYALQALFFFFLGIDDRFMVHEYLGERFEFEDAYIVAGFGVLEAGLLVGLAEVWRRPAAARGYLLGAAAMFAVTVVADGFLAARRVGRLSLEDLSKTWAGLFLCLFAWSLCREEIASLRRGGRDQ
jgi:hypothetical protein